MTRPLLLACVALLFTLPGCLSPESRVAKGDDLYLQGHYVGALRQYQLARKKDPSMPGLDSKIHTTQIRVFIARGDQCVQNHDWDAAIRAYEEVRRIDPQNAEIADRLVQVTIARATFHFERGQKLLQGGNPFDAVPDFETTLALQPDHRMAASLLQRARKQKVEREERAEQAFQTGLRSRQGGRFEEALRRFAQALELNPHHVSAGLELEEAKSALVDGLLRNGDAAMAARRFGDALTAYHEAKRRQPNRAGVTARIHRAELEAQAERLAAEGDRALASRNWRLAFDRFDAAVRLTAEPEAFMPSLDRARNGLAEDLYTSAENHERAGRYEDALVDFGTIATFHPAFRDCVRRHQVLSENIKRAERTYESGCRAFDSRDLFAARDHFTSCAGTLPAYRDVVKRLADTNATIGMAERFYDRATMAENGQEHARAQLLYEECLAVVRPFRDVDERLRRLQQRSAVGQDFSQYDEGCRAQTSRDLQKARECFQSCQRARPGFRDVERRLQEIETELANAGRIYAQAVAAETRCELEQAQRLYEECLVVCSRYSDSEQRLTRVVTSLRDIREAKRLDRGFRLVTARERYKKILKDYPHHAEARQRVSAIDRVCTELENHHQKMVKAERARNFRLALCTAIEIRKKCIGFKDVDRRIPEFEAETDYSDGVAFEEQGRPDAALRCFERLAQRHPNFRDVRRRVDDCRRKTSQPRPHSGRR